MSVIYTDFEFIPEITKENYHLICGSLYDNKAAKLWEFDLRKLRNSFLAHMQSINLDETLFVGYGITGAEIPVLCQIMGRQYVSKMKWVDLWTEYKMFALTHPKYYDKKTALSSALAKFNLIDQYAADKENARDLILYGPSQLKVAVKDKKTRIQTNEFNYTDQEFRTIQNYCNEDVKILPKLYRCLADISKEYPIKQSHQINRGSHCKYAGISSYYQKGYPMEEERVRAVFSNIPRIKKSLQENCNREIGHVIYEANYEGPKNKKVFVDYSFNMQNFCEYIKSKGLYDGWEKTKRGLKLEADYFDEMLSKYRVELEPLYNTRNTIKQLNSTDLSTLLTHGGYIKSESWPFHQVTSRSSPKPSMGFILNLTPWLRMFIHPKPGRAFVAIDFKSQEVLVMAILSQDDQMLNDYLTDIFMQLAIKTGFAPPGATKKTHPVLRENFKPIGHGTNYGMMADSLSFRFFNLFKSLGTPKDLKECLYQAKVFLRNHEKVYYKFYDFLRKFFRENKARGYYQMWDNWIYFFKRDTRDTQIRNVPGQGTGAIITRIAHDRSVADGIDVISLHDALIFECAETDAVRLAKIVSKHMCDASLEVLGVDHMSTETKIYTHDLPYYDPRGEQIYRYIMTDLGLPCPEKFKKPAEILNIHKT